MTLEELKSSLGSNTLSYSTISASSLTNIMMFVNVELMMDSDTLDYYYRIDVDELLNSRIPNTELEELKKQGWSFFDNDKSLILFLKT